MNTLTLIALLLTAITANMVGGKRSIGKSTDHLPSNRGSQGEDGNRMMKCAEENGAAQGDMFYLVDYYGLPLDRDELKCAAACYFEWKKLLVDGKFDKDAYTKSLTKVYGKNSAEAADYCDEKLSNGSQEFCELGANLYDCDTELSTMSDFRPRT